MNPKRVAELHDPHRKKAGSGYLIQENLILTAHHVIAPSGKKGILGTRYHMRLIEDYEAGRTDWIREGCYLCWDSPENDLALLKLEEGKLGFELESFGKLPGTQVEAQGMGFPEVQTREGLQNPEELRGFLSRYAGLKFRQLRLQVTSLTPNSHNEWQGISGTALFVDKFLVGVIVETNKSFAEKALWATPVSAVANDPEFCRLVCGKENNSLPLADINENNSSCNRSPTSTNIQNHYNSENFFLNNAPNRDTKVFTGRENILEEVDNSFRTNRIQVIYALGGVGKTTTALEYAHRSVESKRYQSVFWVRADSEETLFSEFKRIAKVIGLETLGLSSVKLNAENDEESDKSLYKKAVFNWLKNEKNGTWLLVYDNADDSEEGLAQNWLNITRSFPEGEHGRILITSRSEHWTNRGDYAPLILLPYFDEKDSLAFFKKRLKRSIVGTSEEKMAKQLADELGYLPLALEQASAYILNRKVSIEEYLERFRERCLFSTLDKAAAEIGAYGNENSNREREKKDKLVVGTTWTLNFVQVSANNPAASELLETAAFLNPDNIPLQIFFEKSHVLGGEIEKVLQGKDKYDAEEEMEDMLYSLASYSLIHRRQEKLNIREEKIDIHRLVQEVIRTYRLKEDCKRQAILDKLAVCLCELNQFDYLSISGAMWGIHADWAKSDGAWERFSMLFPHVQTIIKHIEEFKLVSNQIFILYNFVADYFREIQSYQEAIAEGYEKAIAIGEQLSLDLKASVTIRLADVYRRTGRFQESLDLLLKTEIYAEHNQLKDHGFMKAFILKDKARIYQMQGKYNDAEHFYCKALLMVESDSNLAELKPSILNSFGNCYRFWGKFDKAIQKFQEADKFQFIEEDSTQTHLGYLRGRHNLAKALTGKGEFKEAEKIHCLVLEERERAYGKDHPVTAESLSALGTLYRNWGKSLKEDEREKYLEKSLEKLERAYEINRKYVELSNPQIEPSLYNLVTIYKLKDKYENVRVCLEEAQNECEASLNNEDTHPTHLGFIYRNLAIYYENVERDFDTAEDYFQKAVDSDERFNVFEGRYESLKLQGFFYQNRANECDNSESVRRNYYRSALSSLEEVVVHEDTLIKVKAEIHSKLGEIYKNLAAITEDNSIKEDYRKKAESNYLLAIELNKEIWGDAHIRVARVSNCLGVMHLSNSRKGKDDERLDKAITFLNQALQIYKREPYKQTKNIDFVEQQLKRAEGYRKGRNRKNRTKR